MNVYDSRKIQDALLSHGYAETFDINSADIVVFYTCNIRENAARKLFSDIGRIQNREKKIIAVGGCVAQAEGQNIFRKSKYVQIVFGPQTYHNLPQYIQEIETGKTKKIIDLKFSQAEKFGCLPNRKQTLFSEFVSIQEGCDNFCTYCVVPYTRGREYSRPALDIINEVKNLVSNGAKEITLIGQNVNSYHGDAAYIQMGSPRQKWKLERLLMEVSDTPGLKRLRYTTSHPKDFTDELMRIHQDLIDIMPPFAHIPVQSGNDRILKMMNRGHTAATYLAKLEKFKDVCPSISFSSDFIVGFPGETDSEFEDTLKIAEKAQYSLFFAFKYSKRENTPAYNMQDQISEKIKEKRLKVLLQTLFNSQLKFNQGCVGQTQEVLFEKTGKKKNQYVGKSPHMQSVIVESDQSIIGTFKKVAIREGYQNCLMGIIENAGEANEN